MRFGEATGLRGIHFPDTIGASFRFRAILEIGIKGDEPPQLTKSIRLCNGAALMGFGIMALWALFEIGAGERENLPWEIGLALGFAACLFANGLGHHRAGRVGMLFIAEAAVFVGAVMFPQGSGGSLPFLAMAGLPFLLFDPSESFWLVFGMVLTIVLYAWCETGAANVSLGIQPRAAPSWYFAANAGSAIGLSILVPLIFYRTSTRAEADLERIGKERLTRLIYSSVIGVARGRLGGPILEANDALLDLLGYTRDDLEAGRIDLGRSTPPEYDEVSARAVAMVIKSGYCQAYEKEYFRKDGARVPVLVGMSMIDPATHEAVGFVLDISEKRQLERHKLMVREKEEAVRLRDLFNSVASHELKTPLSALVLQLQRASHALEKGTCPPSETKKQLKVCESSAKKLGALVEELFDLTKLTQGQLALTTSAMDLTETTKTLVSDFEASGVCAPDQIRVHATASVRGEWDPVRIEQVVTNLVSNAIKYGSGKPVDVFVTACSCGDPAGNARLEVTDHGMGIDEDMLTKIFDPFQRAVSGKQIQGLGLGLFVVKSIVEAHGGAVHVQSKRGRGSTFVVELPQFHRDCACAE
jgi:PAS domain S-box-containing protein